MQQSPLRSLIMTQTSPLLLAFMSLLRMISPQLQQQSRPQILMLSERPGLTTALSMQGQFMTARSTSSSAEQRMEGAKAGGGPSTFWKEPLSIALKNCSWYPLRQKNSSATSIAQMPAAKELVSPSTPMSLSTNRMSLMLPRQSTRSLRQLTPSTFSRLVSSCEVQVSESRLAMLSSEALGNATTLKVKQAQQQQISPFSVYQEESAEAVVPGPIMYTPYMQLLTQLQSCTNCLAEQLALTPSSANRLPLSTISTLKDCFAALVISTMKGQNTCLMYSVLLKLAICMSQPRLEPRQLQVSQKKLPISLMRVSLSRSKVQMEATLEVTFQVVLQVTLEVVLQVMLQVASAERSSCLVQLYLQPRGEWMACTKLAGQQPQRLEFIMQSLKSWLEKSGIMVGRSEERPIELRLTEYSLEVEQEVKSTTDSVEQTIDFTRRASDRRAIIQIINPTDPSQTCNEGQSEPQSHAKHPPLSPTTTQQQPFKQYQITSMRVFIIFLMENTHQFNLSSRLLLLSLFLRYSRYSLADYDALSLLRRGDRHFSTRVFLDLLSKGSSRVVLCRKLLPFELMWVISSSRALPCGYLRVHLVTSCAQASLVRSWISFSSSAFSCELVRLRKSFSSCRF